MTALNTEYRCWILLSLVVFGMSAASAQEAGLTRGAELLSPFKRELQAALRAGLTEGAVEAINVCRLQAPEIAGTHSGDGIRLGRASHRLRNPANVTPDWVGPILAAYIADSADRAPRVVPLPDERLGYVEPIPLQPLCLTCHGETLAPDVASRIAALYPDDRAVGFAVGDLRGVFWIEFPAGEPDD